MREDAVTPLESVLHRVAEAAPDPWYPRVYAERTGYPLAQLNLLLEHLWLDGLLQKGEGTDETGGGVRLSPAGEQLLRDPEAMRRLRAGEPVTPGDRGGAIRAVFRSESRSMVTRLLIGANVFVFGVGAYLAYKQGAGGAFLDMGGPPNAVVAEARQRTGSLTGVDLLHGQWWRLLSSCFVHIGIMHILLNMFALRSLGRNAEPMWGRWRYLLIYLLAGLGGSCLSLAFKPAVVVDGVFRPIMMAGASGAICGLLGAEISWLLLNARYLPRRVVRSWRFGLFINIGLIAFLSAMPQVSALGHAGGFGAGLLAGLFMNWQRFGAPGWRWLALVPTAGLVLLSFEILRHGQIRNPIWHELQAKDYEISVLPRVARAVNAAIKAENDIQRKGPNEPEETLTSLRNAKQSLLDIDAELAKLGPYRAEHAEKDREAQRERIARLLTALSEGEEKVEGMLKGAAERRARQKELEEAIAKEENDFAQKFIRRIDAAAKSAELTLKEQSQQLDNMPPRDRKEIDRLSADARKNRALLQKIAAELPQAETLKSETTIAARNLASDYLEVFVNLLGWGDTILTADRAPSADEIKRRDRLRSNLANYTEEWKKVADR